MDEARKKEVIQKLTEKGAVKECPRCGNKGFSLIDQYTNIILQDNIGGIVIGGPTVPCVLVACNNCGYLSTHALGALGLLPSTEQK